MAEEVTDLPDPVAEDHSTDAPVVEPEAAPLAARAPVSTEAPLFSEFDVKPEIVQALKDVGIERTFAIQEMTLPIALAGNDLIGQARTGTGKTLGFGVPLLNRLVLPGGDGALPQALVVAPTRELAVQVSADLASAGKRLGARVLTIYGGRAYEPQIEALKKGVDVAVGTPGRLLDLAQQGHLNLSDARILVLDEADEMLDLGFLPDIEKLLAMVPAARQTMLFSATMPGPIVALARQFLIQPIQIRAEQETSIPSTSHVDQFAYRAHAMDKAEMLARILQARDRGLALIFTRTKRTAQKVADDLEDRGFAAAAIHGDLGQGAREQALRAFRSGKVDVLVATDVAARGLDVDGITHVVNYQAPEDAMTYVHRIGRTARAGKKGTSITFVDWDDVPRWKLICDTLDLPFHEPVETYSTSPHLRTELDIPEGVTGTLPRSARTREGLDAERIEDLGGRDPKGSGGRQHSRGPARDRTDRTERTERPARNRNRTRTRTRGGQAVDGSTSGSATGSEQATATTSTSAPASAPPAGQTAGDGASQPGGSGQRRRRRGSRGRGRSGGGGAATGDSAASE
ncbi:DEAD/DEAH box helicase [Jatrophihabitans endophyticus]|uniref:DEAD/DEAH box helicase n=1 Tax=Jatrophihabitans endophyticus TaxID=1206085 RepID=UPI0019EB80DA|nr:DEAD/DEAH box helicase [Jatrophihabitans endophyticus]MBE7188833.1 DEAD/DEAH box helicase [Jatrophihabitans endophyticus]